jgi:hypothetical protein
MYARSNSQGASFANGNSGSSGVHSAPVLSVFTNWEADPMRTTSWDLI